MKLTMKFSYEICFPISKVEDVTFKFQHENIKIAFLVEIGIWKIETVSFQSKFIS